MTRLANAHWRPASSEGAVEGVAVWSGVTLAGILAALYLTEDAVTGARSMTS